MSLAIASAPDRAVRPPDRVVIFGGGAATHDLLRLATIRSDDVVLIGEVVDEPSASYARRFAVEHLVRPPEPSDFLAVNAILVALRDLEEENVIVRAARGADIPIHVSGRPLVSDFTLLEFLERRAPARAAG